MIKFPTRARNVLMVLGFAAVLLLFSGCATPPPKPLTAAGTAATEADATKNDSNFLEEIWGGIKKGAKKAKDSAGEFVDNLVGNNEPKINKLIKASPLVSPKPIVGKVSDFSHSRTDVEVGGIVSAETTGGSDVEKFLAGFGQYRISFFEPGKNGKHCAQQFTVTFEDGSTIEIKQRCDTINDPGDEAYGCKFSLGDEVRLVAVVDDSNKVYVVAQPTDPDGYQERCVGFAYVAWALRQKQEQEEEKPSWWKF